MALSSPHAICWRRVLPYSMRACVRNAKVGEMVRDASLAITLCRASQPAVPIYLASICVCVRCVWYLEQIVFIRAPGPSDSLLS